jgi:hypothetical protein
MVCRRLRHLSSEDGFQRIRRLIKPVVIDFDLSEASGHAPDGLQRPKYGKLAQY